MTTHTPSPSLCCYHLTSLIHKPTNKQKQVEVTNCFAVPHAEVGEEVAIGKDFNKQMLALHLRANKKETVVGWYASASQGDQQGDLIANTSPLIHDFYASETDDGDPIHLVVDTRLLEDAISAHAYRSKPVIIQGEPLANLFHEVRLTMESTDPEKICLQRMVTDDKRTNGTDAEKQAAAEDQKDPLLTSMQKLYDLLEKTSSYVDSVVDGTTPADPEMGREVADTLAAVPRIRPEVFDQLFNDSLQDLLMVEYLSSITRTQVTVAEKLNASLGV